MDTGLLWRTIRKTKRKKEKVMKTSKGRKKRKGTRVHYLGGYRAWKRQ